MQEKSRSGGTALRGDKMRFLVTGGAGFIGSNFIRLLLKKRKDAEVVNLDKLTYAGNLDNLKDVGKDKRYRFVKGDICDSRVVDKIASDNCDIIVNFAAESHVDRSINDPGSFIMTDVYGTHNLLEAARKFDCGFVQVSTDEVYGSIGQGSFFETSMLNPSSPYSSSKAGGELVAKSYFTTYGVPVLITRSSNNFGPFQHPEKLVPLFITNALEDKELPVYGDGSQVRDWLYVDDNCSAILAVIDKGKSGEMYNIGAGNEFTNLEITRMILAELGKPESLVRYVRDRPGHDARYSISTAKIHQLGWKPSFDFRKGLSETVKWYKANRLWWQKIKSGEFLEYYRRHYYEKHGLRVGK